MISSAIKKNVFCQFPLEVSSHTDTDERLNDQNRCFYEYVPSSKTTVSYVSHNAT